MLHAFACTGLAGAAAGRKLCPGSVPQDDHQVTILAARPPLVPLQLPNLQHHVRRPQRHDATQPGRVTYFRLLDIRYGDRCVVAFHANLVDSGKPCLGTRFNMSTSFVLLFFAISSTNWELFFCANGSPQLPAGALQINCSGPST